MEPRYACNIGSIYHGALLQMGMVKSAMKRITQNNDTMSGTVKYVKYTTIGIIKR